MVNPVDKLRKEQQKKLLLKQKKARQERNKTKFQKQSRDDVASELEKLRRKPKSMVNPKDEQKMKSLEKMLEEKREEWDKNKNAVGPNAKGPKDVGVGVNYDDFVGDRARDVKDSVYYHPTLNPLGKPPPGKPQKYVQRKSTAKVNVGMALPAPEKKKKKRKREGDYDDEEEGSSDSSSSDSSSEEEEGGNIFTKNNNESAKREKVPGPPKGPPPPLPREEEEEDDDDDEDEEKYAGVVIPAPIWPPPGWTPPAPSGSPPTSDDEGEGEEIEGEIVIDGIVVPPPPPDDTDEEDEEEKEEKVETAPPPPPLPVGITTTATINAQKFGHTLEMKAQSHMASLPRQPPPSHLPMRATNIYQRPPPIHSANNPRGPPPPQHFFSPAPPMAVKKKSHEQATISGKATTIAAPSQNPALQKLVPAHLRVQRHQHATKKKVNPAPDATKKDAKKDDNNNKDDQYLNFLDDVASLGAFQE
jgi:hypothetical protein